MDRRLRSTKLRPVRNKRLDLILHRMFQERGRRDVGRLLLLSTLVVFVVGAVASAAASADTCNGGSHLVFCNDNSESLVGQEALGTGGLALMVATVGGAEIKFHCKSGVAKGILGTLGSGTGLGLLLGCVEEKPAGCDLSAAQEKEIDVKTNGQLRSVTLALITGSGVAEEFTTLEIVNLGACTLATGNYPITGKQLVEIPKGGSSLSLQEIVAKKAGSFLTFDGHPASFSETSTNVHLPSGLPWLVMAGE
jgi:hypothetical protein